MKPFTPFDKFEKSCSPRGKTLAASMQENCDDKLAPEQPAPCSAKPCPPYWQRTENKRCLGNGLVDVQELDGCGNERWVRTSEVVVWTDTTETTCVSDTDATERIYMQQVDQCGNTRRVFTGRFCCVPAWIDANDPPVYDCTQSMLRVDQIDGCGGTRLQSTGLVVLWTDTLQRRCLDDRHQREETNQCGDLRWVDNGPLVWTDLGETRCVGALIEKQQTDQCGNTRWVATSASLAWVDTVVKDCTTTYQVEQENQCGDVRWSDRGAVIWTNTGETRCITDDLIENEQVNQCGELRWNNTGVSCIVVPPSLPASIGPGCLTNDMGNYVSYRLAFGSSGTATETISPLGGAPYPFAWAAGVVDGSNYEIKIAHTFTSGIHKTYSGPTVGVWTSLGASVVMEWTLSPSGVPYGEIWSGTVSIRENGNDATLTEMTIDELFMALGLECP